MELETCSTKDRTHEYHLFCRQCLRKGPQILGFLHQQRAACGDQPRSLAPSGNLLDLFGGIRIAFAPRGRRREPERPRGASSEEQKTASPGRIESLLPPNGRNGLRCPRPFCWS